MTCEYLLFRIINIFIFFYIYRLGASIILFELTRLFIKKYKDKI